jgi:hypothetical protein
MAHLHYYFRICDKTMYRNVVINDKSICCFVIYIDIFIGYMVGEVDRVFEGGEGEKTQA